MENAISTHCPVPKTGQTTCYDQDNHLASQCEGTELAGQDGHHQAGVMWPNPRFYDEHKGTVTDNLTGLIWLKNANCLQKAVKWDDAFDYITELNQLGQMDGNPAGDTSNNGDHNDDWRLPNVRELLSLVDYGQSKPALPELHPFDNVYLGKYWSSTTYVALDNYAWTVDLEKGLELFDPQLDKLQNSYVWPVRGGL